MTTQQMQAMIQQVIDGHPDGEAADYGVLLNRLVKVCPEGITMAHLRASLNNYLAGARP